MNKVHDFPDMISMRAAASAACTMLKILANEDRLLILCQLINGPNSVGELDIRRAAAIDSAIRTDRHA